MKEKDRLAALRAQSEPAKQKQKQEEKKASESKRETPKALKFVFKPKVGKLTPYEQKLAHAGIVMPKRAYVALCMSVALFCGFLASVLGSLLASGTFVAIAYYSICMRPIEKAEKRKKKIIKQLPPFIDGVVASLSTGSNLDVAVVQATQAVPKGLLRDELLTVCAAIQAGFSVKEAALMLRERIPGQEIVALVVSLSLFSTMGGTVLDPFQRLAVKLREQQAVLERASRDLVMVKQSFYLLFFLSLGVPPLLMLVEPDYLADALNHSMSKTLLQTGALMVLGCVVMFKKITSIRF